MTLKVLVVDDASFVRDMVKRTLRNRFPNLELHEATNGRKALAMMNRSAFDLILCDWEMPEMTGLELLHWMRQHEAYKTKPFVMITSRGDKSHVLEAIKEGASEYLSKPFSAEALLNKVIKVMGKRLKAALGDARPSIAVPDAFRQSADLLSRGRTLAGEGDAPPAPAAAVAGSDNPLLAQARSNTKPAAAAAPKANHSLAAVRFASGTLACVIKAINLNEVKVIARRDQQFPGILEAAVVDMEIAEGKVARLNGYVHQLAAVDKRMDTDFVSLIIRFVDEDPEKLEDLSRFIARFQP